MRYRRCLYKQYVRSVGVNTDAEIEELYYNRYKWYNSETGCYISEYTIGLAGDNPTLCGYVFDSKKNKENHVNELCQK